MKIGQKPEHLLLLSRDNTGKFRENRENTANDKTSPAAVLGQYMEIQGNLRKYREIQGNTGQYRETQGKTGK